ncbi:MAG TPA: CBS domain-containing protein [Anaeromyxobacter sp.]|nr:CBS domain-containing protein [Anaeromyxobacter sp.]
MTARDAADVIDPLEGDEGEPDVGRHRDVGREILATKLADVTPRAPVTIRADAPVSKAVELMRAKATSAVVVVAPGRARRVVGVFTERDLVQRALPSRRWASARVDRYMTPSPETLRPEDPIAYAINRMTAGGYGHVPLVDRDGRAAGIVSAADLLAFVVELCPEEVLNLPPEPELALHPRAEGE